MTKKYHFIAVGGVGMSGLAKYLLQEGYEVSGSDISDSKYVQQLRNLGGKIFIGHDADNVPDDSVIVVSSAIRESNPELKYAREKGMLIYHRSDLLAEISKTDKCFIGFSGTHGKTTTSGMASYILSKAGDNPSYVVGGIIPDLNTNADYNKMGKHFVAELDESDGTIVKYSPNVIVVNNLEADHLDFYTNGLASVLKTFNMFLDNNKNAKVLVNIDNTGVAQLRSITSFITYGLNKADYVARNIKYSHGYTTFEVYHNDSLLTDVKIILPGEHNVYNALAVIASVNEAGCTNIKECAKYLAEFSGMGRRFQKVGEIGNIDIYDDYAHHPTEIKSTLTAMKSFTDKKIVAVFQPHRYTRLKSLWEDFKIALESADRIIVTDVYAASEDSIQGINSYNFASEINAEYIEGTMENVARKLLPSLSDNSVVIGLGAGTITNLGKELLKLNDNLTRVN